MPKDADGTTVLLQTPFPSSHPFPNPSSSTLKFLFCILSFFFLHSLCFRPVQGSHRGALVAIKTKQGPQSPMLEQLIAPHSQVPLHPSHPHFAWSRAKLSFFFPGHQDLDFKAL